MWNIAFLKKKFEKFLMYAGGAFLFLIMTGFFTPPVAGPGKTVIVHEYARAPEPSLADAPERTPLEWFSQGGEGEGGESAIKRLFPNLKEVSVPPMHFGEDRGLKEVSAPPMHFGVPQDRGPRFVWRNGRCVRLW